MTDREWMFDDLRKLLQQKNLPETLLQKLGVVLNDRSLDRYEPEISELRKMVDDYNKE